MGGTTISMPRVNITKAPAQVAISNAPHTALIVGEMLEAGNAVAGSLVEIGNRLNESYDAFGRKSHLSEMIRQFKRINNQTKLYAIPLKASSGASSATATITLTGTATADFDLTVSVVSRRTYTYVVNVLKGNTANDIATQLNSLIANDINLPVTASVATGVVTLTATNAGVVGNQYGASVTGAGNGVTATVTAFTGGTTTPDLVGLFDNLSRMRVHTLMWPTAYNVQVVSDFLTPRWNVPNNILDGVGIISRSDTLGGHKTYLGALNTNALYVHCNRKEVDSQYSFSDIAEADDIITAQFGAIRALRLTTDTQLSQYMTTTASRDLRGGTRLASCPYFNTSMPYISIMDLSRGWQDEEITELADVGGSCMGNNIANNMVILGESFTTYKTDNAGNPDITYKFLEYVDTFSNIAEYNFNNLRRDFAQVRLTDSPDVVDGIVNTQVIKGAMKGYYVTLASEEYLLTRGGADNIKYYYDNIDMSAVLASGQVLSSNKCPLVTQLRQLDVTLQAIFDRN